MVITQDHMIIWISLDGEESMNLEIFKLTQFFQYFNLFIFYRGIWNVPFVALCYLVNKSIFKKMNFDHMKFDPDIALSESLRNQVFMSIH